jgi:hypothetical protein
LSVDNLLTGFEAPFERAGDPKFFARPILRPPPVCTGPTQKKDDEAGADRLGSGSTPDPGGNRISVRRQGPERTRGNRRQLGCCGPGLVLQEAGKELLVRRRLEPWGSGLRAAVIKDFCGGQDLQAAGSRERFRALSVIYCSRANPWNVWQSTQRPEVLCRIL